MTAFLFPGQGSQSPGMGRDFYEGTPDVRDYLDKAARTLPNLLDIMFQGPAETLALTEHAQVALLAVEAAVNHHLRSRGHTPSVCAGHSLGEFAALLAADSLTFDEALRLVEARGRSMAAHTHEGGMAAVMGLEPEAIEAALPDEVTVANYNGPQQTIISGTSAGLERAEQSLKAAGLKRLVRLPVSGPFHSPYMKDAAEVFRKVMETAEIRPPRCRFVTSVTGEEVSDPEEIRALLCRQITSPVRWTDVMRTVGPVRALEVGPGRVLQGLAKRMDGAPHVEPVGTLVAANALEVGA